MNYSGSRLLATHRRKFRASALIFSFWLVVSNLSAAPCNRINSQRDTWVTQRINALVRAARAAYENEGAQRSYERVLDEIAGAINQCRLTDDRDFVGRYPEFVAYVKLLSLSLKEDHELGFEVSDRVYFAETSEYTKIPDFLLTPRFLRSVSRFETLAQAKTLLREMNAGRAANDQLLFFSYTSRHLGTPDNPDSYRRLLIVVPGNEAQHVPEKWVQFGIADPRKPASVRNVSVVAVVPAAEQTTNVYFKDYFRTYRRNGSITIKGRWELGEGDDNCVECHKSGVLPIFPVSGSVSREDKPLVEAVNERFLTYGRPRFDKYLDASKLGPGLGSARSRELLRGSGTRLPATAGNDGKLCAACHQPNGLGSLNWPMDRVLINSYVNGGQMPFGYELTRAERARLYAKLIQDYFAVDDANPGILKSWLLGQRRQPEQPSIVDDRLR
jgi:hypothetical protein